MSTLNRRAFLAAAGTGALALAYPRRAHGERPDRPNIVLCMADDQGWGDVAYYGHPALKTPNLDDLAATGLRFDHFYAAAPVCSPTRASVMTGRHPNRMGCFKWGYSLRPQEVTIAEVLKQAGYVTGHFGKWHLGSVREGSPVNPGASGFDEWLSAPNFFDNDPILSREGKAEQLTGESSMVTADAAIDFMRRHAEGDKPFFAVVWFGSPHNPHEAVAGDRALYADAPENKRDFYGEITGLDRAVGKLRASLREMDVAENTLFWYCSDNGGLPKLAVTGGRGNKGDIYEGGLRVPAIIEWPARITEPRVTNECCVTSDIYPTLVEITGAAVAHQPPLDGISLAPIIHGGGRVWLRSIGFWDYPAKGISTPSAEWMGELLEAQNAGHDPGHPERLRLDAAEINDKLPPDSREGHAAWNAWPWKLHRIEKEGKPVRFELYNLQLDPMEEHNCLEREPEIAEALRAQLGAWQASVVHSYNGGDY